MGKFSNTLAILSPAKLSCSRILSFMFIAISALSFAQASEKIGDLGLSDFLLSPTFYYSDPRTGSFQAGDSFLAFRWVRDSELSGQVMVGTESLLGVPLRYGPVNEQQIALVEAYAQGDSPSFGRLRMGLIPIPFGAESGVPEARLRFPRSLLFQRGLIGLRDLGASYYSENDGFFTEWAVHNGEGGKDLDNQAWFTARWGWLSTEQLRIGASAEMGRTTPLSTSANSSSNNASNGIWIKESSRIRMANLFFVYDGLKYGVTTEVTIGQISQDIHESQFVDGHADLFYAISQDFGLLGRYDFYQPKDNVVETNDIHQQAATFGVRYHTQYETSTISVYGTTVFNDPPLTNTNQFLVVWKLTPTTGPRR
jgi:hypothetical protein